MSVPAEFGETQRNITGKAAELAGFNVVVIYTHAYLSAYFTTREFSNPGMEVRRVISEPTAAALAYGLHKKKGVENVVVVDLGEFTF